MHGTEVVLKHANKKKKLVVWRPIGGLRQRRTCRSTRWIWYGADSEAPVGMPVARRSAILALACWKERKLPVIIVRFFNTVSPRQTGQYGMSSNFVRRALAGRPITVFGDSKQSARSHTSPTSSGPHHARQRAEAIGGSSTSATRRKCQSAHWPNGSRERIRRHHQADSYDEAYGRIRGHAAASRTPQQDQGDGGVRAEHTLDDILTDVIGISDAVAVSGVVRNFWPA